ncbi:aspartate aminotransferase family protein [Magnetospirillum sp. UT-4]|uniref:aspartate aminotransferase family protein n=1 Tax=Magnetospirillum sp. UT-4 TaxID=2681467 RepID=UPI00137F6A69|nr:aspartate aminotransferase family protein [Magnetospirillum sp. UT-4]CAA7625714.1 putative Glutamate-1-semialdehyde 2,1-aminomutase [Magnetospirillum sp. UT-4]
MAQSALKLRRSSRLEEAQDALNARTRASQQMARDRSEVINGAMAASGMAPPPLFIAENTGATFVDIDGNRYLDTCMGFGVHVLGHRPPAVEAALRAQLDKGWHYSLRGEDQLAYARMIRDASPTNERVVLANTGTEATLYAIRAARALSGKTKVALFDVSYHGAHDTALVWAGPGSTAERSEPVTLGNGIPTAVTDDVLLLPYLSPHALSAIADHADELAAVLVEPIQGSRPDPEVGDFLHALRALCDEKGIILIFDEVLTGFRLGYGGAQGRYGVAADLSTYGKVAGGGMPIGVVAGRASLMASFGDFTKPGGIFFGGTFSGNPMSIAAGLAALTQLKARPEVYTHVDRLTAHVRDGFNAYAETHGFPARIMAAGSMWQIFFGSHVLGEFDYAGKEAEGAFYLHCLNMGIFIHATHRCFFSAAHTDADSETVLDVLKTALQLVRDDGLA